MKLQRMPLLGSLYSRLCQAMPAFLISLTLTAAAAVSSPASGPMAVDREAVAFVSDLLLQRPGKEIAIDGVFHIRTSEGRRREIPVNYMIRLNENAWQSIYATERTDALGPEQLVVTHEAREPNRYLLRQISPDGTRTNTLMINGSEAAVSLASSDFWLSDLGLEFLHWPEQRFVRDAKITMKYGRPLKVIESVNPRPSAGTYSRVVSWIDSELGSLVRAEAYDLEGKRFKVFELKSFKKVNGRWQVKDMEIRNEKTDSRTRLEFNLEVQ